MTWMIAPTPTPSSTADNAALSTAAPMHSAESSWPAADRAEADQGSYWRALIGERGEDGQPPGRVVQGEPDDERRTDSQRAHGVGRPDGQSFTEVVQADTDGDHQGQSPPVGGCFLTSLVAVEQASDRGQDEECKSGSEQYEQWAAERDANNARRGRILHRGVGGEEPEQADGKRQQHPDHPSAGPPEDRQDEHAQRDRDDADVGSE